jgi:Xaa-Pro aminopeptidase
MMKERDCSLWMPVCKAFAVLLLVGFLFDVRSADTPAGDSELRKDLIRRRETVANAIGKNSIVFVFSAPARPRTGDVDYEYRQQNNLYYLTGIKQADTTLVIMPGNSTRKEFIFVGDRDPARETWTGKILSHDEVTAISGIQQVYSNSRFEEFVNSVLNRNPFDVYRYAPSREYDDFFKAIDASQAAVYLVLENKPGLTGELTPEYAFANKLRERFIGLSIHDAWPLITRMRQIKSAYELNMLRKAIDITGDALLQAFKRVKPGAWEFEIQAGIEEVYRRSDADLGFPSIVASGPNATTLHYEENQKRLEEGDLILMDIGAEYNYYSADISRTIPVNGKFSPAQAEIYQIVLEASDASMKKIRTGENLPDVHLAGTEVVKAGLKRLGLITDTAGDQYRIWFMHGVSHWLGMDVHDTGERWRPFEPGMVFTVEPGIYIRADALDHLPHTAEYEKFQDAVRPAFEKYKNIGVRIEDDVLVTSGGYELLSKKAPRTISEIEATMK